MAKIWFKIVVVVLLDRKMFQAIRPGCRAVITRCASVMRVISWCRDVGSVGRVMVFVAVGNVGAARLRRCYLRLGRFGGTI